MPAVGSDGRPGHTGAATATLAVAAVGVVFGDIGTNPLFAMREAFESSHPITVTDANVLGLLSLMFWSLMLVVSLKYLTFVMRADNDGEGGILALAALVTPEGAAGARAAAGSLVLLGLFGAALSTATGSSPPPSRCSRPSKGRRSPCPRSTASSSPSAVVMLAGLFFVQHRGTASLGRIFGPVMIMWFVTIGLLGAVQIVAEPGVVRAVNPVLAVSSSPTTASGGSSRSAR